MQIRRRCPACSNHAKPEGICGAACKPEHHKYRIDKWLVRARICALVWQANPDVKSISHLHFVCMTSWRATERRLPDPWAQKPLLVHDYSNFGMVNGEPLGSGGVACVAPLCNLSPEIPASATHCPTPNTNPTPAHICYHKAYRAHPLAHCASDMYRAVALHAQLGASASVHMPAFVAEAMRQAELFKLRSVHV